MFHRTVLCALVALSGIGLATGHSARAADRKIAPAPAFSGKQLVATPQDGWVTNGGNIYNQRYSPLDQINRDTVSKLKADWHVGLEGSGTGAKYSGQGQPIAYDGVIYMSTGADDVFAVDVATGQKLWTRMPPNFRHSSSHIFPRRMRSCRSKQHHSGKILRRPHEKSHLRLRHGKSRHLYLLRIHGRLHHPQCL